MNFKIEYKQISHFSNFARKIVLTEIEETDLWYDYFQVEITLRYKDANLELVFDWIPIYGFIMTLNDFLKSIKEASASFYEFTEDDSRLYLEKNGHDIKIMFDFTNKELIVPIEEFKQGVISLNETFSNELLKLFPGQDTKKFIQEKLSSF